MLVAGNFSKTDGAYTVTFPVTGKWYDYLTGDEVEVKDATENGNSGTQLPYSDNFPMPQLIVDLGEAV